MTKTTAFKNQYADSRDSMTSLLFRKWTIASIISLGAETKRYSVLYRFLSGVIQKVLTEHLKKLERVGIVRCFAQSSSSQSTLTSVYTLLSLACLQPYLARSLRTDSQALPAHSSCGYSVRMLLPQLLQIHLQKTPNYKLLAWQNSQDLDPSFSDRQSVYKMPQL